MNGHARIGWAVVAVLTMVLLASLPAAAAPNIKEKGTLEAVEDNGRSAVIAKQAPSVDKVVLFTRGTYAVSPYAVIINGAGKKATLGSFILPAKIEYEVEYTAEGPIIKKVREIPQ